MVFETVGMLSVKNRSTFMNWYCVVCKKGFTYLGISLESWWRIYVSTNWLFIAVAPFTNMVKFNPSMDK